MEALLTFFSNIILITAGLAVCVLWLIIFAVVGETIIDIFRGEGKSTTLDEEDYR